MEEETNSKSVKRKKGREWCMTSMLAVVRERFEPEGKVTNGLLLEEGDLVTVIAMNPVSEAQECNQNLVCLFKFPFKDGWWAGALKGQLGTFPSTCVQLLSDIEEPLSEVLL